MREHIKKLETNARGRDIVIGDLHGCVDLLESLLKQCDFDGSVDRVISVGDLIDRGERSVDAVNYLDNDWFYAVMGNHELIMLSSFYGDKYWIEQGGSWHLKLNGDEFDELKEKLGKLPYLIEFMNGDKIIGIVHGEPPLKQSWSELKQALVDEERELTHHTQYCCNEVVWGRSRLKLKLTDEVSGVDVVFSGHTPVPEAISLGNVYFIDSGAYYSGKLTAAIIKDGDIEIMTVEKT